MKREIISNLIIPLLFLCVACDNNSYKENNVLQKESIIIGENEENKKNNINKNYNENEVLVIIRKGSGDISKNKNELLKNAKIIFSFSDDDEKEAILLVQNKNYTTEELIEELKKLPEVISVEPNYNLNKAYNN